MGLFLLTLIDWILGALIFIIFADVVLSWLVAFEVVNLRHPFVRQISRFLETVTRPVLQPFRRLIPPIAGFDITPIIAIVVIGAARNYLLPWLFSPIIGVLGG
jgi:YggT family protein